MAQNIYDRPEFFDGYSRLPRSVAGLDGAAEWPTLRAMLPDVRGLRIVDLGCGFGWFCRWAAGQGAAKVLGLDLSEAMLGRARAMTSDAAITYAQANLEQLELPEGVFDLAYSSLALHYVEDAGNLFRIVHRALAPDGHFVFSIEHPIMMAPMRPEWTVDADGRRTWPLDSFAVEGKRTTDWLTKGVIKYHRRLSTTLNLLISAGFTIRHLDEFCPTDEQIAVNPSWEQERDRPTFLLVSASRR